jgi:hypothetical protein
VCNVVRSSRHERLDCTVLPAMLSIISCSVHVADCPAVLIPSVQASERRVQPDDGRSSRHNAHSDRLQAPLLAVSCAELLCVFYLCRPQSAVSNLMMGGAAGTIAATVCYPLDTIRRRMQVRECGCCACKAGVFVLDIGCALVQRQCAACWTPFGGACRCVRVWEGGCCAFQHGNNVM